jgi:hypothetical protein
MHFAIASPCFGRGGRRESPSPNIVVQSRQTVRPPELDGNRSFKTGDQTDAVIGTVRASRAADNQECTRPRARHVNDSRVPNL